MIKIFRHALFNYLYIFIYKFHFFRMSSNAQTLQMALIATWVTVLTSIAHFQPPQVEGSIAEMHSESIICPGEPSYCGCQMIKNPTYMYVVCYKNLSNFTDFSMFNETIIPSKMLLQCDPRIISSSTLGDGVFDSLHAFFEIEIKGCLSMHISGQAFRGMSSLKDIKIQDCNRITMARECLQIPDLSNLETVTIVESGLYYAPILCGREHLWLVNLTRNNLATFTDTGLVCDTPTNVEIIDISENAITDLPPRMSSVTGKLMSLSASNNKISDVVPSIFENLTSVLKIDLSTNRISQLPTDVLGINSRLQTLKLAQNKIGSLPKGIFSLTPEITFLNLNDMALNDDIWHELKNMSRLKVLQLSHNNIQIVENVVLNDMKQLKILDLSDNSLCSISIRLFKSQSELRVLSLTRNNITFIKKDAFMGLHYLFNLDIQENNIHHIHPEALSELSNLEQLNLSSNIITILPTFPASLQLLDLRNNHIGYIDNKVLSGLTNLLGIGLAHNRINFIHQNAFMNNTKLQVLYLGYNNVSSIDYHMFPPKSSLDSLFLEHNNISEIWTFPNEYFPHLRVLDIRYNKIETLAPESIGRDKLFPDSIEELYLARNDIFFIEHFVFQLPSLRFVDLRENKIMTLPNLVLEASEENPFPVTYHLSGNPFLCDCDLQWLREAFTTTNKNAHASVIIQDQDLLFCKFLYYYSKPQLMKNTPISGFICPFVKHCFRPSCNCCKNVNCTCLTKCPIGCTCYRTRDGLGKCVVDCLYANLSSIPFDIPLICTIMVFVGNNLSNVASRDFSSLSHLTTFYLEFCQIKIIENGSFKGFSNLSELNLNHNFLQTLNPRMFEGLESLQYLSVSFNQIYMIEYGTFESLKRLQELRLDSNQLKMLSDTNFKRLSSISSLKLSDNPWSCDCDYLEHMKNFTIANAGQIKDIHNVSCLFYNSTSNETVKYPLADVHLPDFCVNQTTFYNEGTTNLDTPTVVAMSTVLSLFVLGMIIFGVVFWNRQFLKVWCFVKFGWKWHQKEIEDDALRPYDAFVAYSSDDDDFVIRELVPYLEKNQRRRPGYRLCVHYRDFAVGASIAESIISAVKHSKRVIIILSENFLHSEWCQFEFQKAYHQLLEEKRNRIIMILLHDINNQMLDNQLKDYLKTRTYVKYGDPWFWAKVEYAMPKLDQTARQNQNVIPNDHIQLQNIIDGGDVANDDAELLLDDMRNHQVDDHEQVAQEIEMEIEL